LTDRSGTDPVTKLGQYPHASAAAISSSSVASETHFLPAKLAANRESVSGAKIRASASRWSTI
jgi:hypothetical protein